jgi:hypothetical protein
MLLIRIQNLLMNRNRILPRLLNNILHEPVLILTLVLLLLLLTLIMLARMAMAVRKFLSATIVVNEPKTGPVPVPGSTVHGAIGPGLLLLLCAAWVVPAVVCG